MARWQEFRQCPGCTYDFATGEGEKSCDYYDCPYLPPELSVVCSQCMYDFFTDEGNAGCPDPSTCEEGAEARANVANMREWLAGTGRSVR